MYKWVENVLKGRLEKVGYRVTPIVNKPPGKVPGVGPHGGGTHLAPRMPTGQPQQDPYVGQDPWLSPGQPLSPKQPDGSPPRKFQYQPGYNIQISPRSTEEISFVQLRMLSEYSMIRVIIEHLKEQIVGHEWDITAADDQDRNNYEAEITQVKNFFDKPDGQAEWDEWIALFMEEVLVLDALSIYRQKTYGGELHALEIIDGSTIKVLSDTRGMVPTGQFPAYQQFLYGVPYGWFIQDEMYYLPRNRRAHKFYGYGPIEQLVVLLNQGIRRELHNLAQFTDGTTPAGFATLPEDWSLEDIKEFELYVEELLAGQPQRRSKILWAPAGTKLQKFRDEETFNLQNKFDEWLARIFCFKLGISSMPFLSMTNRATATEFGDIEAEGGVASFKMFIKRFLGRVIKNDLHKPHLKFIWTTDRARMQEKRVMRNTQYVEKGIFQVDEVRREEGKEPLGLKPGMMTASGYQVFPPEAYEGHPGTPPAPGQQQGLPGAVAPAPARPVMPDGSRPVVPAGNAYSALRRCKIDELGKWARWATTRLEKGQPLQGFKATFIERGEVKAIEVELTKARTKDRIKFLFDTRKDRTAAVRLEPPNAGDVASRSQDIKGLLREVLLREVNRMAPIKA